MDSPIRHHNSILTLALTFFAGLVLMPLVVFPFISQFATATAEYGDLLRNMQVLSGVLTLFYVVMRRSEGDFRALFILNVLLFAGAETFSDIARRFGVSSLHSMEMLFTVSLFIYGALALAAAIADERRGDWFHHALVTAVIGFVFLAGARMYFERKGPGWDERSRYFTFVVLGLLAVQIVCMLVCAEIRNRQLQKGSGARGQGPEQQGLGVRGQGSEQPEQQESNDTETDTENSARVG
jgi:peptidoglycan/LPS O-acetylase OafA/YrhL